MPIPESDAYKLNSESRPESVEISLGTVFKLRRDEEQRGLILDPRTSGDYFGYVILQLDERLRNYWVSVVESGNKRDIAEIVGTMSLNDILIAAQLGEEKYGTPVSPKLLVEVRSRAQLDPRVLKLR